MLFACSMPRQLCLMRGSSTPYRMSTSKFIAKYPAVANITIALMTGKSVPKPTVMPIDQDQATRTPSRSLRHL